MTNRLCVQDTVLPSGGGADGNSPMVVLKGEKVFLYFYVYHRDERRWGPDVLEFKPERWAKKHFGWDFIPFGGGPRVCIGQHYGLAEASYVLMRICQQFDLIDFTDERDNSAKVIKLTVGPSHGVNIKLHHDPCIEEEQKNDDDGDA